MLLVFENMLLDHPSQYRISIAVGAKFQVEESFIHKRKLDPQKRLRISVAVISMRIPAEKGAGNVIQSKHQR
jgi:hypothetical protein